MQHHLAEMRKAKNNDPTKITLRSGTGSIKGTIDVVEKINTGFRSTHNRDGRFGYVLALGSDGYFYETKSNGGGYRKAKNQRDASAAYARHRAKIKQDNASVRSMVCRLGRALPSNVNTGLLFDAGIGALADWRRDGCPESLDTVVRKALLSALQTDERMPAHIRQSFADVTDLKIPTYPEPSAI